MSLLRSNIIMRLVMEVIEKKPEKILVKELA